MESGYYEKRIRIKADAKPIDDVTKFAWEDGDYEEVEEWREYTRDELDAMATPSAADLADAVADVSEAVSANAEDLQTMGDALAELSALVASMSKG